MFFKFNVIYLFVSGGESEEESDLSESEEKSSDESETEKSSEESSDSSETEEEKVSPNFPVYLPYFFQSITSFEKSLFLKEKHQRISSSCIRIVGIISTLVTFRVRICH